VSLGEEREALLADFGDPTGRRTHAIERAEQGRRTVMAYAGRLALPALRNSLLPQFGQSFSVDALLRSVSRAPHLEHT
jgi:hypothetical protein